MGWQSGIQICDPLIRGLPLHHSLKHVVDVRFTHWPEITKVRPPNFTRIIGEGHSLGEKNILIKPFFEFQDVTVFFQSSKNHVDV